MKQIQPIDYSITLSTNERINIAEIDVNTVPDLIDPDVVSALSLLSRCMNLTREAIEDAKRGNDRVFRDSYKSPVSGLMKVEPHICRLHGDCVFYNKRCCSAHMAERHHLPICWEYEAPAHLSYEKRLVVTMIGTEIVQSWATNQIVVIVKD